MSVPAEKKGKIPDAPTPQPAASGNLLSCVAPPSVLPNFVTAAPNEVLLKDGIKEGIEVLENKTLDTNKSKQLAWQKVVYKRFNEIKRRERTISEMKQQWRSMKLDAKRKVSIYKRECKQTEGGKKPPNPDPETEELVKLLPQDFEEDVNEFDSNGPAVQIVYNAPTVQHAIISLEQEDQIAEIQSAATPNKAEMNVAVTSSISSSQGPYVPTVFSAAIPPSKGEPTAAVRSPESPQADVSGSSVEGVTQDVRQLGDPMPGSGLLTWMKGAVSGGGILQKVAEKAKSSVDTMITTLDPQMKEYLNSGGDIEILVASDKDDKVSPVREAFQSVFGKATVMGIPAQSKVTASQPVGQAAALSAAKERIAQIRSNNQNVNNNVPIIAIESFVVELLNDRWFDLAALVLTQPSLNIDLLVFSQATPVPSAVIAALKADTPADYQLQETGFCNTVGAYMAANLKVQHSHWHEASTTVARRDMLLLAAKSLAGSYQKLLTISSTDIST